MRYILYPLYPPGTLETAYLRCLEVREVGETTNKLSRLANNDWHGAVDGADWSPWPIYAHRLSKQFAQR